VRAQKKNAKEKTPLDVAMQVGEDKIVRLLKALLRGEPPPQEAAGDDDDDDDDDEAYPVNETSTGAKATGQAAPPLKAVDPEAVEAKTAEVVQVAELVTKLQSLSFSTAGELGISNPSSTPTPTLPLPLPLPRQARHLPREERGRQGGRGGHPGG
jgi:hypothetical protein